MGFFVSLLIVLATRLSLGEDSFREWGWRIPFLVSLILVALSLYIRWSLRETPLFSRLKAAGKSSSQPLKESLGSGRNWKMILLALLGGTAGQAVVWYTGQFYAFFFLLTVLKVPTVTANVILAIALAVGTPFFLVFGWLSVPYHLGNGWFGGFTPFLASSLVAATGNIYAGLSYPIVVALMTFFVGSFYLKETHHVRIWEEVEGTATAPAGN